MSHTRKDKNNEELNECESQASLFERIATERCRPVPGSVNFQLDPIHWEKSTVHSRLFGDGIAAIPASGVYSARGSGALFKSLHSEEECRQASIDAITELKKCVALRKT